ncbi:carboxypeptidase B [Cephus cinctus]|uniref:Carboxypeptidase B n=1 Tax=Cephus cinctus TaxID=211228 RepID=A0AAJ7BPU2_CEPCN|nr:carboxypeptidase B [Cephus cinctus]
MRFSLVLLVAFAAAAAANEEILPSLRGMQAIRIMADTEEKLNLVKSYEGVPGFDFIKLTANLQEPVNVLVTAEQATFFKSVLERNEIDYNVYVNNVLEKVEEEKIAMELARNLPPLEKFAGRSFTFTSFPRYNVIVSYLQDIVKSYSNVATLLDIGTSYEGRTIYAIKISSGSNNPAILIDAGIHAREWAAPVTSLYVINELVENPDLYANVDWYIIPTLNPDGYEYTFTTYRLWRKTRSVTAGSTCLGVDGNRNFELQWMLTGASSSPCSDTYAGKAPFSEVETQALRNFVLANKDSIKLYLTYHSYGNYILYPWGYTSDLPDDEPELRSLAEAADDAIASLYGTRYTIGSSTNVLYAAAGGSDDWVKGIGGVELSYTIELPGGGWFGFDLPASRIIPVGAETFESIKVFGKYIAQKFGSTRN